MTEFDRMVRPYIEALVLEEEEQSSAAAAAGVRSLPRD